MHHFGGEDISPEAVNQQAGGGLMRAHPGSSPPLYHSWGAELSVVYQMEISELQRRLESCEAEIAECKATEQLAAMEREVLADVAASVPAEGIRKGAAQVEAEFGRAQDNRLHHYWGQRWEMTRGRARSLRGTRWVLRGASSVEEDAEEESSAGEESD